MTYADDNFSPRRVPHSPDAEESLLGAMLISRNAIEAVIDTVVAGDFYTPRNVMIFDAMSKMYMHGEPIDFTTLSDKMRSLGTLDTAGGAEALLELMTGQYTTANAKSYAKTVADLSVLRKVIGVALEAAEAAYSPGSDAASLVEAAQFGFAEALSGLATSDPEDLWILDEFLDRPLEDRPAWIIPGLLRRGWRAMMVAGEGSGKTVLFRQIGIAAAQGIHPLTFAKMDPVRVLIVDLENPEDSIHDVCNPLRAQAEMKSVDYDSERAYLWHRPGGIDLRSRRDRVDFETVIARVQPDLVCIGPLYKAYSVSASEADEQASKEIMQVFDDLRTRYGFGLMLEHHAPKGTGSSKNRDLVPYGSSLWLRWPELGLKMTPVDNEGQVMKVGRWRGDRLDNEWPSELHRGGPGNWMWTGVWPTGTFSGPGSASAPSAAVQPALPSPSASQGYTGGYADEYEGDEDDFYNPPY